MQSEVIFSREAKQHIRKLERYLAQRFYAANAERFERSATIYFAIEDRQVVIVSVCYGGRMFERESE
ncbi:MAG TPA: hypothetical protein VGU46_04030 [Acidobacteriaceae bacterium]|nr:hypothetical protein [Acidobacteriaceae bacterium]